MYGKIVWNTFLAELSFTKSDIFDKYCIMSSSIWKANWISLKPFLVFLMHTVLRSIKSMLSDDVTSPVSFPEKHPRIWTNLKSDPKAKVLSCNSAPDRCQEQNCTSKKIANFIISDKPTANRLKILLCNTQRNTISGFRWWSLGLSPSGGSPFWSLWMWWPLFDPPPHPNPNSSSFA